MLLLFWKLLVYSQNMYHLQKADQVHPSQDIGGKWCYRMRFRGNEHLSPVLFIKTFKRKEVGVEIHVHAQLIWRRKKNTILYYFPPPQQYKQCLYHKWHRFHHITEVWLPRLPVNFLHHFPYTGYDNFLLMGNKTHTMSLLRNMTRELLITYTQ